MYGALGLLALISIACVAWQNRHAMQAIISTGLNLPPKLGIQLHKTPGPGCSNAG